MSNSEFIKNLPDVIPLKEVLDGIKNMKKVVVDVVLPAFRPAKGLFDPDKPSNRTIAEFDAVYKRRSRKKGSIIDSSYAAFDNLPSTLDMLWDYADKNISDNILKDNISLYEINILRLLVLSDFAIKYSLRLLEYYYASESSNFKDSSIKLRDSFSKEDLQYLEDNFLVYSRIIDLFIVPHDKIFKELKQIADISVNERNIDDVLQLQNKVKTDPLNLVSFFDVTNTLLYKFQRWWMLNQVNSYKVAEERKRLLEHRLLLLKRNREGSNDPILEKEIMILEDRIAKMEYRLERLGEKYGL